MPFSMKNLSFLIILFALNTTLFGQSETKSYSRKGEYSFIWGYNRSAYLNSDIHFLGNGYDFKLFNVTAKDKPTPISHIGTYINPATISIPQFNCHGSYFINDHWAVSIGWDHMKYVANDFQTVKATGHIDAQVSDPTITVNPQYVGTFTNKDIVLNPSNFLHLEHTDGFNYVTIEMDRYDRLWTAKNNKTNLDWFVGGGIGAMVPRSDVHLFGVGANHYWNLSGYGFSTRAGLRYDFSKRFFFQTDAKLGFSRLNDIPTTGYPSDYAKQSIGWGEVTCVLGYKWGKHRNK